MSILNNPKIKVLDKKGEPIVGARMYIYYAGTDNKAYFYADADLTTILTNPLLTDEYGDFPVCYTENTNYKLVIKDALGNLLYTIDDVNFYNKIESIITSDFAGNVFITNDVYEGNIIFHITNYDNPTGLDILTINASSGEIQAYPNYEDNVKSSTTLINKGYIEKNPPLPMDYIARLPVTFTNTTITVGPGCCKASNNKNDIRITENLTVNFQEETVYAFTEGQGTITFPSATTGKVLLVAGGGAGGGYDVSTTAVDQPIVETII
jgi:hypothetical protein